jgi:hypothetical protein
MSRRSDDSSRPVRASSTPAKRKGIPLTPLKLPTVLTSPEVDQFIAAIRKPALRCFFWPVYCLLIKDFTARPRIPFGRLQMAAPVARRETRSAAGSSRPACRQTGEHRPGLARSTARRSRCGVSRGRSGQRFRRGRFGLLPPQAPGIVGVPAVIAGDFGVPALWMQRPDRFRSDWFRSDSFPGRRPLYWAAAASRPRLPVGVRRTVQSPGRRLFRVPTTNRGRSGEFLANLAKKSPAGLSNHLSAAPTGKGALGKEDHLC